MLQPLYVVKFKVVSRKDKKNKVSLAVEWPPGLEAVVSSLKPTSQQDPQQFFFFKYSLVRVL